MQVIESHFTLLLYRVLLFLPIPISIPIPTSSEAWGSLGSAGAHLSCHRVEAGY